VKSIFPKESKAEQISPHQLLYKTEKQQQQQQHHLQINLLFSRFRICSTA